MYSQEQKRGGWAHQSVFCLLSRCKSLCLQPIRRLLDQKFPDMQRIETKSLHKGVAGARHTFLKQQPGQDKLNLLLQVS